MQTPNAPDLTNIRELKRIERLFQTHARSEFSQHWLIDRGTLDIITEESGVHAGIAALELGAGFGALTIELARKAKRVFAVEIENAAIEALQYTTQSFSNITIVREDLLKLRPEELFGGEPYVVAANLPYAITSKAIRYYLETPQPPAHMTTLIQKEVAKRIIADDSHQSLLSLSVRMYADARIVADVPAHYFRPPPEVDSAVVGFHIRTPAIQNSEVRSRVFQLAKYAFEQKRKQIHNILQSRSGLPASMILRWLEEASVAPDRRPQTLSIAEWERLVEMEPRKI